MAAFNTVVSLVSVVIGWLSHSRFGPTAKPEPKALVPVRTSPVLPLVRYLQTLVCVASQTLFPIVLFSGIVLRVALPSALS